MLRANEMCRTAIFFVSWPAKRALRRETETAFGVVTKPGTSFFVHLSEYYSSTSYYRTNAYVASRMRSVWFLFFVLCSCIVSSTTLLVDRSVLLTNPSSRALLSTYSLFVICIWLLYGAGWLAGNQSIMLFVCLCGARITNDMITMNE